MAADVHGKNQRSDGSLGRWIEEIEILDGTGEVRRLHPRRRPGGVPRHGGGHGPTGVILGATIRLLPIRSAQMLVSRQRMADLDALLAAMDEATDRYCVAWIDTTATGRSFGRGIVEVGDHLAEPDPAAEGRGLAYRPHRAYRAPRLPVCPFTTWSAREFNGLHFRTAAQGDNEITSLATFFHRLDALDGWNRTLGPRGFVEYQCVVPEGAHGVIAQILEAAQRHRCAPFLGTLKRFGPESGGHLSYPLPGWSVSIDMPAEAPLGRCWTTWTCGSPPRAVGYTWPGTAGSAAAPAPRCTRGWRSGGLRPHGSTRPGCSAPIWGSGWACGGRAPHHMGGSMPDKHGAADSPARVLLLGGTSEIGLEILAALGLSADTEVLLAGLGRAADGGGRQGAGRPGPDAALRRHRAGQSPGPHRRGLRRGRRGPGHLRGGHPDRAADTGP